MNVKLSELRKSKFIEKIIFHCHDQSLYLVSVIQDGEEIYVTDEKGGFLKSFSQFSLQSKFNGMMIGDMVLRHQSSYDEMIGLSEEKIDNTLEVRIGNGTIATQPVDTD